MRARKLPRAALLLRCIRLAEVVVTAFLVLLLLINPVKHKGQKVNSET